MSRRAPRYVSGVSGMAGAELPSLSVPGADHVPLAADISLPGRYIGSPEDLQRQINAVQQRIETLSASKPLTRSGMGSHSLLVGSHVSDDFASRPCDSGGKTRSFLAGLETPRQIRKLPEIPAGVSDSPVGDFVTRRQPRPLGHPGGNLEAAPVVATVAMPTAVPPKSDGDRKVHPTIKLPAFDGKLSLESFLAKLQNCSDYYNWTDRERTCHLKAALEVPAAQILWQIEENATEKQIIELLRNRFGDLSQQERYRAKLYARKCKKGESAQSLCFDIGRLLALGFPGESGKMAEIVGRDCFLNSLDNPQLRIKILELQPANLDEALNHVCRLEAYESLLPEGAEVNGPEERKKVRSVKPQKTVTFAPTTGMQGGNNAMEQKIKQLEIEQVNMRREMQQASADAHFWKERALAAESGGWGPRNSGWPSFPPPSQPHFLPQSPVDQFALSRCTSSGAEPQCITVLSGLARSRSRSPWWLHACYRG